MAQAEDENAHRDQRHRCKYNFAGEKQAQAVGHVIQRLEQKLADVAVLDVGRDLPVVLADSRQGVHDGDQQIIRDHAPQAVTANGALLPAIDGLPEVNGGQQRNQPEPGAKEEIDAVHQRVLKPNLDDMPVFAHHD